jgi:hypothetical protein
MAFDPDELVTLTNHGTMKLRSAVARAMILPLDERKRVTIVRNGKPASLKFERIKDLAADWATQLVPSEPARNASRITLSARLTNYGMKTAATAMAMGSNPRPIAPALQAIALSSSGLDG